MRWSQLQQLVESFFHPALELRIFCTVHRSNDGPAIGRYWLTLDKEILWEYPQRVAPLIAEGRGDSSAKEITALLRTYIDTNPVTLIDGPMDQFGLSPILAAADRRMGKRRLQTLLGRVGANSPAGILIERRLNPRGL